MSAWGWPQWVIFAHILLIAILRTVGLSKKQLHAEAGGVVALQALVFWVLWMGGFWS